MKREIKFRAWDKKLNKMYDFADISDYPLSRLNNSVVFDFMQFTGLKDKNGKEIYEGDIMSINNLVLGKIIFENGCFQIFDINSTQGTNPLNKDRIKKLSSVGNIYENPELL